MPGKRGETLRIGSFTVKNGGQVTMERGKGKTGIGAEVKKWNSMERGKKSEGEEWENEDGNYEK